MAALDHFLLAELLATPTGEVRVQALASGLRQGQAVALAQRRCRAGVVQFVASPRLRNPKLLLAPDTAELKLGSTGDLEARLALWLPQAKSPGNAAMGGLFGQSASQAGKPYEKRMSNVFG